MDEVRAARDHASSYNMQEPVTDELFADVPSHYRLGLEELRDLQTSSSEAGNFALGLTRKLFPELWGPGNLRLKYSYNGGGVCNKEELDAERKAVIVKYLNAFYPATKKTSVWKDSVIPKINKGLRRNDDEKKKKNKTKAQEKSTDPSIKENNVPPLQPLHNSFQQDTEQVSRTNRCLSDTLQNISHPFTGSVSSVSDILNDLS